MKTFVHLRILAASLAFGLWYGGPVFATQAGQRPPLGLLRTSGEVFVNESLVSGDLTLFVGDTLRTGADGAAGLNVPGRGVLTIGAQTQISFPPSWPASRYFVTVKRGSVGLRSLVGAKNFQVQVGKFVVVPVPETEAGAEIEVDAEGSARITCKAGSVGVVALEGEAATFLLPNRAVAISAEGKLQEAEVALPAAPEAPVPPAAKKKSHAGYVILAVVGGGAAGAAVALASRKQQAPASPSVP